MQSNSIVVFLPTLLGLLLVGGVLLGSRLSPRGRRRIETFVFLPCLVAATLAACAYAFVAGRSWPLAAALIGAGGWLTVLLVKHLRRPELG